MDVVVVVRWLCTTSVSAASVYTGGGTNCAGPGRNRSRGSTTHTHTQYSSTYSIKGSFYFFASFLLSLLFDYYGIHNVSRGIFSFLISSNECQNGVKPLPTYLNLNSNDDDNGLYRKNLEKKNSPWRVTTFFVHFSSSVHP